MDNAIALQVTCPYCGSARGQSCRQTMLDGRPVTETHRMRFDAAIEIPF